MKILAIETSCDETAAAIVEEKNFRPVVLTSVIASQLAVHAKTGGVVPDLAARLHTEALPRVLQEATKHKRLDYDAVAVTVGPGLIGCLLVGAAAAKTVAAVTGKPFFAINHLEGHIYSAWLPSVRETPAPELPALVVIVSGGHSELVLMERHLYYQHLGSTRDDAAGEAFDKVARLLGLGYPGGPAISELARRGNEQEFGLPVPLEGEETFDFSFSGLKAAVVSLVGKLPKPLAAHTRADLAASFQATVSRIIARNTARAVQSFPEIRSVCLVGGVAANDHLRTNLERTVKQARPACHFIVPPYEYCTDNAAMIGAAALFHHLFGKADNWAGVTVDPNLKLGA